MDRSELRVGAVIELKKELRVSAGFYRELLDVSYYPVGTTFMVQSIQSNDFGVMLMVGNAVTPNEYGVSKCEWHSYEAIVMDYYKIKSTCRKLKALNYVLNQGRL